MALRIAVIVIVAIVVGTLLALLGRGYTFDEKVLSWTDWRVLQAEQTYRAELGHLQQDVEALVELVNLEMAEPVRGQLAAEQIAQRWSRGESALAVQREALTQAAQAVRDWSIGAVPRETALAAVEAAVARITEARDNVDR